MTLTVLCVWVAGHVPFTPDYVVRLRSMARRALPPHRFVCLTDHPERLPADLETRPARVPPGCKGWWAKVQLFDPTLTVAGRLLYLDLDTLVVDDLTPLVEYPAEFALAPDGAPNFRPRDGTACVHRFNSSAMVWDHGSQAHLFRQWVPGVARRLWGDQDWIGEQCPGAAVMPAAWFPRISDAPGPAWPPGARVILCKKPKNAEAARRWHWVAEAWQ